MGFTDYLGLAGGALGTVFGGPIGGAVGGIAGNSLANLFGGTSEQKAADAHQQQLAQISQDIAADRQANMAGRINATQNSGAAFAPANSMLYSMTGGSPAWVPWCGSGTSTSLRKAVNLIS